MGKKSMKLTHRQALEILGLNSTAVFEDIKRAYRKACSAYHPDRNPAGLEMMKVINCAWSSLSDYVASSVEDNGSLDDELNLSEEMNTALNAIIALGLEIEICGTWIWVSGNTREFKEILKEAGYKWAPKKMMWMWKPEGSKSKGRGKFSMDEIRTAHGSQAVKSKSFTRLSA
jgi:DnaJ-class molecular chaperone